VALNCPIRRDLKEPPNALVTFFRPKRVPGKSTISRVGLPISFTMGVTSSLVVKLRRSPWASNFQAVSLLANAGIADNPAKQAIDKPKTHRFICLPLDVNTLYGMSFVYADLFRNEQSKIENLMNDDELRHFAALKIT
jgi:hypothetical protein